MKNSFLSFKNSELPLKNDKANLFLEISTAVSVFLFSITLAAYFMISAIISSWNKNIIDGLTVQIAAPSEELSIEENQMRTNKVIMFFEGLNGVEKVRLVSDQKIKKLMAPWLGADADIDSLPLPKLLNVRLKDGRTFDYKAAKASLSEVAPYASIDNHGIWLKKLIKSASSLKVLSLFILLLVLTAALFSLFYAVGTSLKVHQNIIEILHIMGATDSYVAKQYAFRSFWVGLISSICGMLITLLALFAVSKLSSGLETGLVGAANLSSTHWFVLCSMPIYASVLSMIMAYLSVKHTLGKIM